MKHGNFLGMNRCPHCRVSLPQLTRRWLDKTTNYKGGNVQIWGIYQCANCGGITLTVAPNDTNNEITESWPGTRTLDESLKDPARQYLMDATESPPTGAVILAASAVDSMLKDKGYDKGSLFERIDKAAADHLITDEMKAWAHEVRLDANEQRHSDSSAKLPNEADKKRSLAFADALAMFLYTLPAMVRKGRGEDSKS